MWCFSPTKSFTLHMTQPHSTVTGPVFSLSNTAPPPEPGFTLWDCSALPPPTSRPFLISRLSYGSYHWWERAGLRTGLPYIQFLFQPQSRWRSRSSGPDLEQSQELGVKLRFSHTPGTDAPPADEQRNRSFLRCKALQQHLFQRACHSTGRNAQETNINITHLQICGRNHSYHLTDTSSCVCSPAPSHHLLDIAIEGSLLQGGDHDVGLLHELSD